MSEEDDPFFAEHDAEREQDEEVVFLGARRACALCGTIYTPWPKHERCPHCGAEPRTP